MYKEELYGWFSLFNRIGTILQQDSLVVKGAGHHSVIQIPKKDEYYMVFHRRPLNKKAASEQDGI